MFVKGVSEYIAVFITAIVTLAAGLGIFIYAYTVIDSYSFAFSQSIEYTKTGYRESLDVMASYIGGVDVIVIVVTGEFSTEVAAIYINNTLSTCKLYTGDDIYIVNGVDVARIPSNSIAIIKCPVQGALAYIKIVYRGGEIVSWAAKII